MDTLLEKIQDEEEQAQYTRPRQPQPGFFVRDAPWQHGQQQPPPQVRSVFLVALVTH